MKRIRAVIDTNVIISGIFWGGLPAQILTAWVENKFHAMLSPEILDEYRRVVAEICQKRQYTSNAAFKILDHLMLKATLINANRFSQQVCDDPNDDMFLELAVTGTAKYIVSGDRDLLRLHSIEGISIITSKLFLSII